MVKEAMVSIEFLPFLKGSFIREKGERKEE